MRVYERIWFGWWIVVDLVAMVFAFTAWSLPGSVGPFVLGGVLFAATVLVPDPRESGAAREPRGTAVVVGERGLLGGALGVSVAIASSSLGPLTIPLVVVAGLTSPWMVAGTVARAVAGARRLPTGDAVTSPGPAGRAAAAEPPPEVTRLSAADWDPVVRSLSDQELCSSWRVSYTFVLSVSASVTGVELVNLRQAYLDELERRNPRGVQAWLANGARAAGDPTRHLAPRPSDRRAAD
jgi:hypothetical protein